MHNGFEVIKGYLSRAICDGLKKESLDIVEKFELPKHLSTFSTKNDLDRNQYFYDSYDKISVFFEKLAIRNDQLKFDKIKSVNKIGHALHSKNQVFREFSHSLEVKSLIRKFGFSEVDVVQSMVIFKNSDFGGEVAAHQDQTYLYSFPEPIKGIWIPLEKSTKENGCLWALPYRKEPLLKEVFTWKNKTPKTTKVHNVDWPEKDFIPIELDVGDVLLFDGLLPHKSYVNTSKKSRMAYVFHFKESKSEYSRDNWNYSKDLMRITL
ncbi:phytanoyl-CoA dioxygenase family protein [Bacteriovoracales bacterium]|nr:phytanoyl-CoA dioxygenase family protein [Bacteriovoracales bacterium]